MADPRTLTILVDEKTCSVHAWSRNSRNVIAPVGRYAPTRVAVSRTAVPNGPPGDGTARMAGDRLATTMVKVWQAGGPRREPAQTVVGPNVPAVTGTPVTKPTRERTKPGGRLPAVTA